MTKEERSATLFLDWRQRPGPRRRIWPSRLGKKPGRRKEEVRSWVFSYHDMPGQAGRAELGPITSKRRGPGFTAKGNRGEGQGSGTGGL